VKPTKHRTTSFGPVSSYISHSILLLGLDRKGTWHIKNFSVGMLVDGGGDLTKTLHVLPVRVLVVITITRIISRRSKI